MMTAAAMLLTRDGQRPVRMALAAVSLALQGVVALLLLAATLEWLPTGWPDGIGVYMLVVGATMLMLVALAHQSLRFYRKLTEPVAPATLRET
jgi:hypothetical protein